jgi:putative ABC transport system permease protein
MRWLRLWARRTAGLFGQARRERELADELESHLSIHTEENLRLGMDPATARREAILKLGAVEALKERYRDQRGLPVLEHVVQDLRYGLRTLVRTPGLTLVTLITLAGGIAGPTTMFTMMKSWILEPLPFAQPDALVDIRTLNTTSGSFGRLNPADFLEMKRAATSLADMAAYHPVDIRLAGLDRAERLAGARVTSSFFSILGVGPELGRVFGPDEAAPGEHAVAIISHGLWRERFKSDRSIVGRVIRLDGTPHTVIGVLPESFHFTLLGRANVWTPLSFTDEQAADHLPRHVYGIGRLKPKRTVQAARDELARIAGQLAQAYPETNTSRGIRLVSLADEVRRHHDAGFVVPVIFAMMTCVLLVAAVNVTNVMLARASARRHEMAVRVALGASRVRLASQWLVEHLALFLASGALGAGLAVWLNHWVTNSIPFENRGYLRNYGELSVDRTVLLFAFATGALCGLFIGWLTIWAGAKADVNADLRDAIDRTATSGRGAQVRRWLVVGQVALALGLLISAGLLVQSARKLSVVDVGFEPRHLLTFRLSLDEQQYRTDNAVRGFYDRAIAALARHGGVEAAAAGSLVPFAGTGGQMDFFIDGQPETRPKDTPAASVNQCTADYANALRLRLLRGRSISGADTGTSPRVAMINETLAARYFGSQDPLGHRLRLGRTSSDLWTIVGIVADVRNYEAVGEVEPQVYVPFPQMPTRTMTFVVRSTGDPQALRGAIRSAIEEADPAEPVSRVFTIEALIGQQVAPFRTTAVFISLFGGLTLLLAGVGVYGVVSHAFAQRTREIGIRMALGATRTDVAALVLAQIRSFLLAGLIPGLLLAFVLGQALKAFLVGVTPTDWHLYVGMPLALTAVVLLAAIAPARRAASIEPATALRCD